MFSILILILLLILGLTTINLPTKKFLLWFQSLISLKNPPYSVPGKTVIAEEKVQRSDYRSNKEDLKNVFATFDKNDDGFITKQELRDSLKNIGIVMGEKDIEDMVKNVDSNGDGLIDLDEFCDSFASLLGKKEELNKEGNDSSQDGDLQEAFDVFDGDKDGRITVEELGSVLSSLGFKEGNKLEDCKEMIRKVDIDGDGMVSFDEFRMMMRAGHRLVPVS
ncbi:hypothetical protein M9H77_02161 [Catharanthus roseus]|uniref:Uncharacterized protein n=1 Tax=Catharanthus roseus TaxID=4058 RepID=A0ACC0C7R8_CATRO|nr:hypothetical protein M9H77_02161 [Catharanthus roseus]